MLGLSAKGFFLPRTFFLFYPLTVFIILANAQGTFCLIYCFPQFYLQSKNLEAKWNNLKEVLAFLFSTTILTPGKELFGQAHGLWSQSTEFKSWLYYLVAV